MSLSEVVLFLVILIYMVIVMWDLNRTSKQHRELMELMREEWEKLENEGQI